MPSYSMPWVIGPVPIVATLWSAYVTTIALVHRREMTGERFVAAYLFPLGIISAISLMFLHKYDLRFIILMGQIATAACFVGIYTIEKKVSGDPPLIAMEEFNLTKELWNLYFVALIYIFYCVVIFSFPVVSACTISKCYFIELMLGGKSYKFSIIYAVNFVGSLILVATSAISVRTLRELRARSTEDRPDTGDRK
ncbi:hypothetical protein K6M90_04975 [Rhizobium sp. 9T]|uniref:hypothetical protein n=1 Tax=Rhizobium croatiense TaxID=2867516 RepID=UPI001C936946|nr:hypothetical protein [Rhizobium croatiense]MBY4607018.1 hypothetical protein [Rhizobium croatiense]